MKKFVLTSIILIAIGGALWWWTKVNRFTPTKTTTLTTKVPTIMKLSSTAFENNQMIPSIYTCDGDNINPPLNFSDVPPNTQSLALIVDDPDAPNGDWVHWLVWNIPPDTTEIAANSVPPNAVQGLTDFGENKYGGPCPPSGIHHYQFKLLALDTTINIPTSSHKAQLETSLQGHILDQAVLVGLYKR